MNLLDELKDTLGHSLSKHSADFLGEKEDKTSSVINSTFPTLLAGIIDKGATEKGANEIFEAVQKSDTDIVDNVEKIFTRSPQTVNGLSNIGSREIPKIIGANQKEASNLIAKSSGMKRNATSKLMKMSTPFLMSMLGKKVADDNLDASGLMKLVNSQKSDIESKLPSGMTDALELKSFGWVKKEKVEVVAEKNPNEDKLAKKAAKQERKLQKAKELEVQKTAVVQESTSTGLGWFKWLLPIIAIAALVWFLITKIGCGGVDTAIPTVKNPVTEVVTKAKETIANPLGTVNDAALNTLNSIKFADGSAGSQMMTFIKGGATGDGRFRFKNLNYASGSAVIDGESGIEVDNVSSILKTYTDVKIMIEGYTDSQGNPDSNLNLSQSRADAVQSRLLAAGIAQSRISTKGFGIANPIGDNETAEGRKQNRRIEIVLAK